MLRRSKQGAFHFRDDGRIPNHPRWPVLIYWGVVQLPQAFDPAAVLEDLFESNGWGDSWRNGIYDYLHYHSRIHEVLGIARGNAKVRLGGDRGRTLNLRAGDVVILPAGTGHQCLVASKDFLGLEPVRHPASMTSGGLTPSSTNQALNRWRRSSAPARTRCSALRAR